MRLVKTNRWIAAAWLGLALATAGTALTHPAEVAAQQEVKTDELNRKPRSKVAPLYPDVARRMSIAGIVRLSVVVSPNGSVEKHQGRRWTSGSGQRSRGRDEAMEVRTRSDREQRDRGI